MAREVDEIIEFKEEFREFASEVCRFMDSAELLLKSQYQKQEPMVIPEDMEVVYTKESGHYCKMGNRWVKEVNGSFELWEEGFHPNYSTPSSRMLCRVNYCPFCGENSMKDNFPPLTP